MQNGTPDFLINQHRIDDVRGAEDYLSRLGEIGRKFDQVIEGLALRERKGIVPPRFVIERVLAEMRAFANSRRPRTRPTRTSPTSWTSSPTCPMPTSRPCWRAAHRP